MAELESSRIMYEIYQEEGYNRRFRVVFFTELNDHNKEMEINRALAGRHVHDGFIRERRKEEAKAVLADFIRRLNEGESPSVEELESALEGVSA
ncbi:MAG: hypothetical protein EHM19_08980 [Candidatus Latescibacterota bacterium]|nr:MAG: hypothetical protein EHM19_08980 [Candidatus Latescibacterota bacterium]